MPLCASLHERFKLDYAKTIVLTIGDLWIPGPFCASEANPSLEDGLERVYTQLLRTPVKRPSGVQTSGRRTRAAMNAVCVNRCLLRQPRVRSWHQPDRRHHPLHGPVSQGTVPLPLRQTGLLGRHGKHLRQPCRGSDSGRAEGLIHQAADRRYSVVTVVGEKIGLVGTTTQILASISSPGPMRVIGPQQNDKEALAAILQPKIDALAEQASTRSR